MSLICKKKLKITYDSAINSLIESLKKPIESDIRKLNDEFILNFQGLKVYKNVCKYMFYGVLVKDYINISSGLK